MPFMQNKSSVHDFMPDDINKCRYSVGHALLIEALMASHA